MAPPKRRAISLAPGSTATLIIPNGTAVPLTPGFSVSVNGLVIHGRPKFEQWEKVGYALRVMERGAQFALGDYLNAVEDALGEKASQLIDYSEGWSESTCRVYRYVAKSVAEERRRMDRLHFAHHLAVAGLQPAAQKKWLDRAADSEEEPWTVRRLIDALKSGEDMPEESWWMLVACNDPDDQKQLKGELEAKGRACKPVSRRSRKKR
jgi:hypothetical protein